jgi:2-desacetyl-2-hydroxyethyl bacteriochlorophyllide A dehydrogenase
VEARCSLISTGTEGICLGRLFEPDSHWDHWVKYPFYPGYNMAGVVREVGAGVSDWKPGDRVAARTGHRLYNITNVEGARLAKIPDAVSDETACWFGMASIAQTGVRAASHKLGDSVVIIGMGLLGQLVTQFVRLMGAREIIAIDTSEPRLQMAKAHGATQTLAMGVAEAHDAVWELTSGRGADVVYDITGHPAVFAPALGLARRFGELLLLGDAGSPSEQRLTSDVILRGVRIIGAHDGHPPVVATDDNYWSVLHMTELFFTYLQREQMRLDDLITHRYKPEQASEAYEMLMTNRSAAMGVVFDWT